VIWADGAFVKLRDERDGTEIIVPKTRIERVEVLKGTQTADAAEITPDLGVGRMPDMA
jgi:hypothetical protein